MARIRYKLPTIEELRERYVRLPSMNIKTQHIEALSDTMAWNKHTGEVIVSVHALERFNQKVCNKQGSLPEIFPQKLLRKFQKSFERAELTEIPKEQRALRVINNRFERAQYLLDTAANIRFVIPETKQGETLTIVTAERPR